MEFLKDIEVSIDEIFAVWRQVLKEGRVKFAKEQDVLRDINLLKAFLDTFEKFIERVRENVLIIYPQDRLKSDPFIPIFITYKHLESLNFLANTKV